jgi:hypothetical protein
MNSKIKNIGILNFQFSNFNYGAVLQAAALESYLSSEGYCIEHIDFRPNQHSNLMIMLKKRIKKLMRLKGHPIELVEGGEVFEVFRRDHLNRSKNFTSSDKEFKSYLNKFDCIIVGSDQVWRPDYTYSQPLVFFLESLNEDVRRVSYAASFGNDCWNESYGEKLKRNVKRNLDKFHSISVREKSGLKICKDTFNIEVEHVADPTLIVVDGFFDSLADSANCTQYNNLVYYKLDETEPFLDGISLISKKYNYTVENIYHYKNKFNSVAAWLAKIKNSKLVVTDSYHCVCFCVLFKKQFICSANPSRGLTRLESLLDLLGLSNRLCLNDSSLLHYASNNYEIDYDVVHRKLSKLRTKSKKFLNDALN